MSTGTSPASADLADATTAPVTTAKAAPPLRTAPGTALCLAGGILTLFSCLVPPVPFLLGVFTLLNGWRAARTARLQPDRYRGSAVPLAGTVLVIIGWVFAAIMLMLLGAGTPHMIHPDPSGAERW